MEGSATMRTALVLLVAAFVCIEGRNMPAGQGLTSLKPLGVSTVEWDWEGMGGMPGIGNGVPGLGMLNPPASGFGFVNPPGFGVVGVWPTMLSPPAPGLGHGGAGGWGFNMVNSPVAGEAFTFPGFGGVPANIVGTIPHPTGEGKGSP